MEPECNETYSKAIAEDVMLGQIDILDIIHRIKEVDEEAYQELRLILVDSIDFKQNSAFKSRDNYNKKVCDILLEDHDNLRDIIKCICEMGGRESLKRRAEVSLSITNLDIEAAILTRL